MIRQNLAIAAFVAVSFFAMAAPGAAVTCNSVAACVLGNNTGAGVGIEGVSQTNVALYGVSTANHGIDGRSRQSYGVVGYTFANGTTTANARAGVYGIDSGTGGYNYGVFGSSANGTAGVAGTATTGFGVYGYTTANGIGVYGTSSTGYGVYGSTTSGSGYGVLGIVSGGIGVYGASSTGYALQAASSSGYGLYSRTGTGTGAFISTGTGYGVIAYTGGSVPFYGRNSNGNGSDIQGTYIGLLGRAPASGGFPLTLTDTAGNNLFYVDGAGNVNYKGGIFNFARMANGATVRSYSAKSALPTVEDTGTAQLANGTAVVRLDPTFAASIDTRSSYRVFVTPNGDTRGLFVATKTANGFIVREAQAGHASVSFDYRIVATALGQAGQRMAALDSKLAGMPQSMAPLAPKRPVAERAPALRRR